MKALILITESAILMLLATMLVGCRAGKTHWEDGSSFLYTTDDRLVCDASGQKIADVERSEFDKAYFVFGGNGARYGEFETLQQAKAQAESLVTGGLSLRVGARWLTCNGGKP